MNYLLLSFLALGELSLLCLCQQAYTVQNVAVEPLAGDEQTLADFRLKTVKRERFLNGTVVFLEDMSSGAFQVLLDLSTSSSGDGNYKRTPISMPKKEICDVFKDMYLKLLQPTLKYGENTNFPHVTEEGMCPLPAGEYYIKEVLFNTESWPNQVPRGLLKAELIFLKNDVNVGGIVVTMKIEDRRMF